MQIMFLLCWQFQIFERLDKVKQILFKLLLEEGNPEFAINNFNKCLERANSKAIYNEFLNLGFNVIIRDGNRTI